MRKQRIVVSAALVSACALAGWGFLPMQDASAQSGGKGGGGFGPLPPPKAPHDIVKLTPAERLGKDLLYDHTLSNPKGYACATCHIPQTGYTGPSSQVNAFWGPQPGVVPGRAGKRRPQTYAYAAFSPEGPFFDGTFAMAFVGGNFWDGRATDTTDQARGPFVDPNEMANIPTNGFNQPLSVAFSALVAEKAVKNWGNEFKKAYGPNILKTSTPAQIYELVCAAIATFEASGEVCQFSSKYDASKFGVPPMNKYTLTASEERGRLLYFGNTAQCSACHSSAAFPTVQFETRGKDTFTMYCFANIGVPRNPGNPFYAETDCTSNPHGCNPQGTNFVDFGLGMNPNPGLDGTKFMINTPGDVPQFRGLFQAPTTRNVDLRPDPKFVKAYMHNGVFKSLKQVVHFYNKRNIAVSPTGQEVAFDLRKGPPSGYTRLFPPPEVLDNVINPQGALPSAGGQIGNLGLTDGQENDLVAFLMILSDGFTKPNPVSK